IYVFTNARSRIEERQRRTADSFLGRGSTATWIRHRAIDRAAFARRASIQCGVALSPALSLGKARVDPGTLGRAGGAAATPVLSADRGRQTSLSVPTRRLAGVRRRHQ